MTTTTLVTILISVMLSAVAQAAFKIGVSSPSAQQAMSSGDWKAAVLTLGLSPAIIAGFALYGFGTVLWLSALAKTQLSQAYPFVSLGFLLTAAIGFFYFNDVMSWSRASGIALVIAGVCLVARS